MEVNIQIDETLASAARSCNVSPEEWIQEAIAQKLQSQSESKPTELEERKLELLARLYRTFKLDSPARVEIRNEDEPTLKDLAARAYINPPPWISFAR